MLGLRSSRFGPTMPFVPAALRVWQSRQPALRKTCFPAVGLPTPPPIAVPVWALVLPPPLVDFVPQPARAMRPSTTAITLAACIVRPMVPERADAETRVLRDTARPCPT